MRFEVLVAVAVKVTFFCAVMLFSLINIYGRLRGSYSLHLQDRRVRPSVENVV
jgi:hypothetical protein